MKKIDGVILNCGGKVVGWDSARGETSPMA